MEKLIRRGEMQNELRGVWLPYSVGIVRIGHYYEDRQTSSPHAELDAWRMTLSAMNEKSKRVWLNRDPSQHAMLGWDVSCTRTFVSATVHITDCNRSVNLDFSGDEDGEKDALHKVDVMLDQLTQFRKHLISTYDKMAELKEK